MRELWPFLRLMRRHLIWVLLGMLLALITALSGIGMMALIGWFVSATALGGGFVVLRSLAGLSSIEAIRTLAGARIIGRYLERVTSHEATFRILARIRCWFYERLEPLNPARLQQYRSADLLNRLIADVSAMDNLYLRVLSPSLIAIVVSLLVFSLLLYLAPVIAPLVLLMLLGAGFFVPLFGYRLGVLVGPALVSSTAALRDRSLAYISGMAELTIYNGVLDQKLRIEQEEARLVRAQLRMSLIAGLTSGLMLLLTGFAIAGALAVGLNLVQQGLMGSMNLALVLFCVLAAFEVVAPLPMAYQYLGKTRAAAQRLQEIADQESDIAFPDATEVAIASEPGRVVFDKVSFAYDDRPVLNEISLEIAPGEKVALLGHTGSGKSSLINLLARFWEPQSGQLLLSGQPIQSFSEEALRAQISVLAQPVHLFAGSVRSNLLLADAELKDELMLDLMDQLGMSDALGSDGLAREVGEGGSRLSGGQRKRLGIARALLKPAHLLVLDEPCEGLDTTTSERVLDLVLAYKPEQSLLLITHHLHALERFDRVIVLDQGCVLEQGTPQALLADPASRLYALRSLDNG
ncbi:thiol reductant ABC exporter subunit CydC [Nitrincola alkalilacustris]|uniref:thiol reductant ABC exporter subunit CydC n=1 Tax=Nitrincola alkalilacustris TaxID=1571224 RepID=UPI00124C63B7|nr:thiol reductant ABC exporter subunit CydC [Nitrincola alkalilacustris]